MSNLFFFNREKIITFGLIVFFLFVWFSQPTSAISVVVNSPTGIVNWSPGAHVVDWNVLAEPINPFAENETIAIDSGILLFKVKK